MLVVMYVRLTHTHTRPTPSDERWNDNYLAFTFFFIRPPRRCPARNRYSDATRRQRYNRHSRKIRWANWSRGDSKNVSTEKYETYSNPGRRDTNWPLSITLVKRDKQHAAHCRQRREARIKDRARMCAYGAKKMARNKIGGDKGKERQRTISSLRIEHRWINNQSTS